MDFVKTSLPSLVFQAFANPVLRDLNNEETENLLRIFVDVRHIFWTVHHIRYWDAVVNKGFTRRFDPADIVVSKNFYNKSAKSLE